MKRATILCLLLCMAAHTTFGTEVPLQFPRAQDEPADVYPDKVMEKEYNPMPEIKAYADASMDKVSDFLDGHETEYTEQYGEIFIGEWKLVDKGGYFVDKKHRWGAGEYFDIINYYDKLYYRRGSTFSYLYYDSIKTYIQPNFFYGVLKEIKIIDGNLYFYVLNGDEWVLDPIHEGGKYFYKKYPPVDVFIP